MQQRELNMKQARQYSCASLSPHQTFQIVWKVNRALGEDCFLNAVEDLGDYKGNEYRGTNDGLVDPLLMQASSHQKVVFLMHLNYFEDDDLHFE